MVLVENITLVHDAIDGKTASFIEVSPRECFLEFSPVYSTTSSFVSFFLPSFVMLIIYFHLYSIARRHSNSMKASVLPASKYLRRLSRPSLVSSVKSPQRKFRTTNDQLRSQCVILKGNNKFLRGKYKMALPIVLGYVVNEEKEGCDLYAISEPNFFLMVYQRQTT